MFWHCVKYTLLSLIVFKIHASDEWSAKFEGLQKALKPASGVIVKDADLIPVLNEVTKCAMTTKNRLSTLELIPDWFKKTQSMYVTTGIRHALRFLVETAESADEELKQIEILRELSTVTRHFPPSMEDEANLREVRSMLGFLANNGKNIDVKLGAVECSIHHASFPWACRDTKQLVPILRSFLEGDHAIHDNLKAKAKAIAYLSQLIETADFDFVMDILQESELTSPDVTLDIAESHSHLAKIAGNADHRSKLFGFLESHVENRNNKVRFHVAEGLQFLAEKSAELSERQNLSIALGRLVKDEETDVVLEASEGFEYLAKKAKEIDERNVIQGFVQELLKDCEKDGRVKYGAIAAYRELVANSESPEERRILREISPDFLTKIGSSGYWLASSVCKAFCENSTEAEERLFIGKKLSKFFTAEINTYNDISYDIALIFSDLAARAETTEERLMVLDVLTRPNCWPTDKVNAAIAAMYATDCKLQVQAFIETALQKMEILSNRGMAVLRLISKSEQSGVDLEWIKTIYLNTLIANSSGAFWYVQEEAIAGCKELCANISDEVVRAKVLAEFDTAIRARAEKSKAEYEEYTAKFGYFPGDD